MLNETCDVQLPQMKFFGSLNSYQRSQLINHGLSQTKDKQAADLIFGYKKQNGSQNIINSQAKVQYIPGGRKITPKAVIKQLMEKSNHSKYNPIQFTLPQDQEKLENFSKTYKGKYILKPNDGQQGFGIMIAFDYEDLLRQYNQYKQKSKQTIVVQEYLETQLVENRKFDFRIFVVQTSVNPVSLYIYKDSVLRFANLQYNETQILNKNTSFETLKRMMITNTHISQIYQNRRQRVLWPLKDYFEYMHKQDPQYDEEHFWQQVYEIVQDVFNKETIKIEQKYVNDEQQYPTQYFRAFGFDIIPLKNNSLRLLEINYAPGYAVTYESEKEFYENAFVDIINLASARPKGQIYNTSCNEQCKQKFLNSVFDDSLTEDQKLALLSVYDERKLAQNFIPVKPLDELKDVGKYNDILIKYWDQIDNPFNSDFRTKIN